MDNAIGILFKEASCCLALRSCDEQAIGQRDKRANAAVINAPHNSNGVARFVIPEKLNLDLVGPLLRAVKRSS
jgi:hypothetical protein